MYINYCLSATKVNKATYVITQNVQAILHHQKIVWSSEIAHTI